MYTLIFDDCSMDEIRLLQNYCYPMSEQDGPPLLDLNIGKFDRKVYFTEVLVEWNNIWRDSKPVSAKVTVTCIERDADILDYNMNINSN